MSFVVARPEALATAARQLTGVGSALAARNMTSAAATTGLPPAAADVVSALTATQFNAHAAVYQAAGSQAVFIHELLVAVLGSSGDSYMATEAVNTIAAR